MKKRIGDICQDFISETGIYISADRLRYYESQNLFSASRDKDNDYREYSEEEEARIRKVLMLIELGVRVEDIQADNTEVINKRVKAMSYIVEQIKKIRKEV